MISFDGTSIIDVVADRDNGKGGYCDIPSPTCEFDSRACEIKLPNPPFWTSPGRVYFQCPIMCPHKEARAPSSSGRFV